MLLGYKRCCGASTPPSQVDIQLYNLVMTLIVWVLQLLIPEAFRSLPVYVLAILKSKPLKGLLVRLMSHLQLNESLTLGCNVAPDVRNYHAHRILSMPVRNIIQYLYPPLLALHDLSNDIAIPNFLTGHTSFPSLMRDSHMFMTSNGVYVIGASFCLSIKWW